MNDYSHHTLEAEFLLKAIRDAASKKRWLVAAKLALDLARCALRLCAALRSA